MESVPSKDSETVLCAVSCINTSAITEVEMEHSAEKPLTPLEVYLYIL